MLTIATICARGGSVGVPRKNIKDLLGKPLIVHSIEQALACSKIDRVYVSTDDEEIAEVASGAGAIVPFIRPASLATSSSGKIPVIEHLVDFLEQGGADISTIVDLDPTSPLRLISDIYACIDLLDDDCDVVITGYESDKNPYFNMVEQQDNGNFGLVKQLEGGVLSRQQAPKVYSMNASIYVWHKESLSKGLWNGRTRLYVMPHERSVDIDAPVDFRFVEMLMSER